MVEISEEIKNSKNFESWADCIARLNQLKNGFEDRLLKFKKPISRKKFKIVTDKFIIDDLDLLADGFKNISIKYQVIAISDNSVICEGIFNPNRDDYFFENGKKYIHKYGTFSAGFYPA